MPVYRFFSPSQFNKNSAISLEAEETRHLRTVLRLKTGDKIEIINGKLQLATGHITSLSAESATVQIDQLIEAAPPKRVRILVQALTKPALLEWIIEKASELGITHFILAPSKRSELTVISPSRKARLEAIAISAMKQCGRLDLPEIQIVGQFSEIVLPDKTAIFFGDLRAKAPPFLSAISTGDIASCIGPESGFTDDEITFMERKWGAKGVRIATHTLRAETAAITFAALQDQQE